MTYTLSSTHAAILEQLEEMRRERGRIEQMCDNGDASETGWDSTVSAESHTLRQPSASPAIPGRRRGLSAHRGIDR